MEPLTVEQVREAMASITALILLDTGLPSRDILLTKCSRQAIQSGMTSAVWAHLSARERSALQSNENLTPELAGYLNCRVEVIDNDCNRRRFWVGKSSGWQPSHLEIKRRNSSGGDPAAESYQSVRLIKSGPR